MFAASAIFLFTTNVYCASYFDILKNRLESLCDPEENYNIKSYHSFESKQYISLIDCIKEHELLIQYVKRIDYLYRYIMFGQVFSSVMQICFSGFQILLVKAYIFNIRVINHNIIYLASKSLKFKENIMNLILRFNTFEFYISFIKIIHSNRNRNWASD